MKKLINLYFILQQTIRPSRWCILSGHLINTRFTTKSSGTFQGQIIRPLVNEIEVLKANIILECVTCFPLDTN